MVGVALERGCEDLDLVYDGKTIARREAPDEVLQFPRGCDGADVSRRLKFPKFAAWSSVYRRLHLDYAPLHQTVRSKGFSPVPWSCLLGQKPGGVGALAQLKAEKALVSALMADSHA